MMRLNVLIGLGLALSVGAFADDMVIATGVRKAPSKPVSETAAETESDLRQPASSGQSREKMQQPQADWKLRLDLTGGLASLSNNSSKDRAARDNSNIDRNAYFGLNSEFQWGQYLGVGLDTYLSSGTAGNVPVVDPISGGIDSRSRKISQSGVAFDLQGRYTLEHWGHLWNWRAGLGYGMLSVNQTNPPVSASATASTLKVSAPYLTGGLEIRVIPHVSLNGDAAVSFGGSTSSSVTTASGTTDTALDSPRFVRYRLGVSVEITPEYLVGIQYIRRELRGTASNSTARQVEATNQFLSAFTVLL